MILQFGANGYFIDLNSDLYFFGNSYQRDLNKTIYNTWLSLPQETSKTEEDVSAMWLLPPKMQQEKPSDLPVLLLRLDLSVSISHEKVALADLKVGQSLCGFELSQ